MFNKNSNLQTTEDDALSAADGNKAVTIQIRLNGMTTQNFNLARRVLAFAALVTVVSAVWGAGTAWWIAWTQFSGSSSERELNHARLVASEVTKSIAANGALAHADRDLLSQIRDAFDRLMVLNRGMGSVAAFQDRTGDALLVERRREESTRMRMAGRRSPDLNVSVRGIDVGRLMKVEALSYFRLDNDDVLRVDLGHHHDRIISGEVIVLAKYTVNGAEKIVGCCGDISDGEHGQVSAASGVQFRARFRVRKHIAVSRPTEQGATLVAVKIGILTAAEPVAKYSDWIAAQPAPVEPTPVSLTQDLPKTRTKKVVHKLPGRIDRQDIEKEIAAEFSARRARVADLATDDEVMTDDEIAAESADFSDTGNESALHHAMTILSRLGSGGNDDVLGSE